MKKFLLPALLLVLFLPYFWRPFALNLNPDMGLQMMDVFRMVDARFSLAFDPSAAYANPLVQMLVDFHGIFRQIIYFPVFYVLDFFGMGIREATVYGTLLVVGILITYLNYLFVRVLVGEKKALWFTALLSVIPFYVLQVKGGWWHMFVYPLLLAGLAAEHKFLNVIARSVPDATKQSREVEDSAKKWYALFCLAASLYLLADTGFVFGGLLYVLYAVIFFWQKFGLRQLFGNIWRMLRTPWTLLPFAVLMGSFAVTYLGKTRFGAEFGIMARFLEKGGHVGFSGLGVVPHFISQGMGLTGFVLFPFMLLAAIWVLYVVILELRRGAIESRKDAFLTVLVVYFFVVFALLLLAGGGGGSVYELYIPGLLLLVYAFSYLKKAWIQNVFMVTFVAVTFAQTVAYNFEMKPPAFLAAPRSFIRANDACTALWCPWHFTEPKNLGVTTAAFALRDYLGITPVPFTSMQENFYDKPKELFFYSNYGQGPSMSIGRRISYEPKDIVVARVIVVFTPQALEKAKTAADGEKNQAVWDFLVAHPEYKEVGTVTMGDAEMIKIFERDSVRELRIFAVEEYDAKFNERYGHLRDMGFIDLG